MSNESETKAAPKRVRRFLRFSLRGLLVVVAICSVWLGIAFHRAREQARAVKAIEAAGGYVLYDYENASRSHFVWGKSNFPSWLLDALGIDFFHDVGVVVIENAPATDGVKYIPVNDDLLARLDAVPETRSLYLYKYDGTNRGLAHIGSLRQLRELTINSSDNDPVDIGDAGLAELSGLRELEQLHIFNAQISDHGLQHIKDFTHLQELILDDTQVTREGAEDLSRSLPDCAIWVYRGDTQVYFGGPHRGSADF
jgi:hypothetical protein